jgi:hypothetical protein
MTLARGADPTFQNNVYMPQGGNSIVLRGTSGILSSENALWGNCPLSAWLLDPSIGVFLDEDFVSFNKAATDGDYVGTQATAGSAAISTTVPGSLLLDAGDSTAHHGYQIQRLKAAFIPAAGKDLWFEAKILLGTALTIEAFVGLAASDTTIIAAGAMSTNNRIGWTGVAGDGVMQFDCDKAGTGNQTTGTTLSITVPHKLGFYYDGTADTVQQFIDGVAVGSAIATTYIPKLVVYPSFVCQSTGTSEPTMTIQGYRVFQLR